MFEIKEFCHRINLDKPNFFKQLKDQNLINPKAYEIEDLEKAEKTEYDRIVRNYYS